MIAGAVVALAWLAAAPCLAADLSPTPETVYYPRSSYVWPYATGPAYGRVAADGSRAAGTLLIQVGAFRLDRGPLPIAPELTASAETTRYFVVQLRPDAVSGPRWRELDALIHRHGGAVLRHLPVAAVLARLTPEGRAAVLQSPGLLAIEPYHPAFKLDPAIGRVPLRDRQKALSDIYSLDVLLHRGEPVDAVAALVEGLGGRVSRRWTDRLQIDLPRARLAGLAAIDAVDRVHEAVAPVPWDRKITDAVSTGGIRQGDNPFHAAGIRGAGQVLMVLDNGIQLDAADLSDTSSSAGMPGVGHRKVRFYGATDAFGGHGDDRGCDATAAGGFTHGHLVAAVALGNAEHADVTFQAEDEAGGKWSLSGVAPDARLVAYDAQVTPVVGGCADALSGFLDVGTLYDDAPGAQGSLDQAYEDFGAQVFNFSWGSNVGSYGADAQQVDAFLNDHPDAMLFVAVGNRGVDDDGDGAADPGSVGEPATSRNAVTVGAHGGPDDYGDPRNIDERAAFSSVGPVGMTGRIAPLLMAPGEERGTSGEAVAFSCRSDDNDGNGPVLCDAVAGRAGTSYAGAAVAGSALLVRDYFAQGFYPDGTAGNPGNAADVVPDVSGALVKAVLVASAEFLGRGFDGTSGDNLTRRERFNNEQGYGRVQLDNVLPLASWGAGASGLLVVDGAVPGGANALAPGLPGVIDAAAGETQSATFEVCDDSRELRIALAWIEEPGDALLDDLDLELTAPDGTTVYYGNYFTDDDDRDGVVDPLLEDCPGLFADGTPADSGLDRSAWSLATCTRPGDGTAEHPASPSPHDSVNTTEAIFLSPDPSGAGDTSQVQAGVYTLRVLAHAGGANPAQAYALAIAGGVCGGSTVALDATTYACSDTATITVHETSEPGDPAAGLSAAVVAGRTLVQVLSPDGATVLDTEAGDDLGFVQPSVDALAFVAADVLVGDGTDYDPGNGVLDARHGDRLRVLYADESTAGDGGDPDKLRVAEATVDCRPRLLTGTVRFAQFGTDTPFQVLGGCERNARGLLEFGYPDRYMDAGESVVYGVAFASVEDEPLEDVTLDLSCVSPDADSPPGCAPDSAVCPDPRRENNPPCRELTILDSPQHAERIEPRSTVSPRFQVQVHKALAGTPEVEMVLRVTGGLNGRGVAFVVVNRHRLNVDEVSSLYSTDFPHGGTLLVDRNNNGLIENPVTTGPTGFPTSANTDYVFETVQYSDLTQGLDPAGNPVTVNDGLLSPWNFDTNDGGFSSGLAAGSDHAQIPGVIAQWGEDLNFNGQLDGYCEADPRVACVLSPIDVSRCHFCSDDGSDCVSDAGCSPGATCSHACVALEERDYENFPVPLLDRAWSTRGGCGWQTRAPGTCSGNASIGCYVDADCGAAAPCSGPGPATGGLWHTGNVGALPPAPCSIVEEPGCQYFEPIGGTSGQLARLELLVTPAVSKVDRSLDAFGRPRATAEIVDWRWNQAVDLPDRNAAYTVELDTDLDRLEPVDLKSDMTVLTTAKGPFGAISFGGNPLLTRGWGMFAPVDPVTGVSTNGSVGRNRQGRNAPAFECGAVDASALGLLGLAGPPDDDVNEGYCPFGGGLGGPDPHLDYCTTVCSGRKATRCESDAGCQGICIGSAPFAYCSNDPGIDCVVDGDCALGACVDVACNGTCQDGTCSNGKPGTCGSDADCAAACVFTSAAIDEFVEPNGPVRNHELNDWNGPDMRFETLGDLFGPTGDRFAGAIGFLNLESSTSTPAKTGYGLGIDDVVLEWREYTLEEDASDCSTVCVGGLDAGRPCAADGDCPGDGASCGGGVCATLTMQADFDRGSGVLELTVHDSSRTIQSCPCPSGTGSVPSGNGDCNCNFLQDVAVLVTSGAEPAGETAYLDAIDNENTIFVGRLPISSAFDAPGTLFVSAEGGADPTIVATYVDLNDGTGHPCPNNIDPALLGQVTAQLSVPLAPAADGLVITRTVLSDNGDDDGWADSGETVRMAVEVSNRSGVDATGVTLRLATDDPAIGCVLATTIALGDLAAGETRLGEQTFAFVVAPDIARADPFEDLTATLDILVTRDPGTAPTTHTVTLDLDLDAAGGGGPTTFFEGFESGFGAFTTMHLDEHLNPPDSDLGNNAAGVINADGNRCQYSDPEWTGSSSYGNNAGRVCYPNPNGAPDAFFFDIATDRAFSGMQALRYNIYLDAARGYTTPLGQLEALRTIDPVNLGWDRVCSISRTVPCTEDFECPGERCEFASPTLTLKQQVSFMDHRSINARPGRTLDRSVVAAQMADPAGSPVGSWIKLYPYVNVYDSQAESNFFNCFYDPDDDGNDEGDFFDPTDPLRSQGPSSTCAPGFSYAYQGDTDGAYDPQAVGGGQGPGLEGDFGIGTWVEPAFDLGRYRGRRLRFRLLETGFKIGSSRNWEQTFQFNPDPGDDGWFVDDIEVTDTLTTPATLVADTKDNTSLAVCADWACSHVDVVVHATPPVSAAPGRTVELDASDSTVDVCLGGTQQYRFWVELYGPERYHSRQDILLRDWSDDARLSVAPRGGVVYGVAARCSTDPLCAATTTVPIGVECPSSGNLTVVGTDNAFLHRQPPAYRTLLLDGEWVGPAAKSVTLLWSTDVVVDALRGDLGTLRADGGFGGSESCILDDSLGTTSLIDVTPLPDAGDGVFYLMRSAEACNQPGAGGSYGGVGEAGDRSVLLGTCPD